MIHYEETEYGFEYGNAKITRMFSDKKTGSVTIGLETDKYPVPIQIYITKTGKVRVHSRPGVEWFPESEENK